MPPLFGLAPGGVCPATPVARGAVRSYRTVSTWPARMRGGLFSVALSLTPAFTGAAGCYPAPFLAGARTFLPRTVPHAAAVARPSGIRGLEQLGTRINLHPPLECEDNARNPSGTDTFGW